MANEVKEIYQEKLNKIQEKLNEIFVKITEADNVGGIEYSCKVQEKFSRDIDYLLRKEEFYRSELERIELKEKYKEL